jgi:hypothetical protein
VRDYIIAIIAIPFAAAGLLWEFVVRSFKAGRKLMELFED